MNQRVFLLGRYGDLAKKSGIYRIVVDRGDSLPRKFYIGQAVNIAKRWTSHVHLLKKGTHWIVDFQADFQKYGLAAFSFEILIICQRSSEILALYEQTAVDCCDLDHLYNRWTKCIKTGAGTPASPERRAKIAQKILGLKRSIETRRLVGEAQAWKKTPLGKEKMRKSQIGRRPPMSAEEREHRSKTTHFRNLKPESYKKAAATRALNKLVLEKSTAWILHG